MILSGAPVVRTLGQIVIQILSNGQLQVRAEGVPADELVIRRMMAQATELLAVELAKSRQSAIEIAPAGMVVQNGR